MTDQPVGLSVMRNEDTGHEIGIIYCVVCETVLNVDSVPEVRYVDEAWMNEHGWRKAE